MHHLAPQQFFEGIEAAVDGFEHRLPSFALFDVVVDAVFDEYFLETAEVPFVVQFSQPDFKLPLQQIHGLLGVVLEHFAHTEKFRLVAHNHTSIRRDAGFAIGKGIQRIDGDVGRHPWRQLDFDFYIAGCIVDYLFDFDFVGFAGLYNRFDETGGGGAKGNLFDQQGLFIGLFNAGPATDFAPAQAFVVIAYVDKTTGKEVWIQLKRLLF